MSKGRHRRVKNQRRAIATAAAMGAATVLPTILSIQQASAASVSTWDQIAKCESGNRWAEHSHASWDGPTGGLQVMGGTWDAYKKGISTADKAYQASKTQQIQVAQRVLAAQGSGAWQVTWSGYACDDVNLSVNPKPVFGKSSESTTTTVTPKKSTSSVALAKGQKAANFAKRQVGERYVYGGTGPNSWDCSGLTQAAWRAAGVNIPRTSQAQWHGLKRVSLNSLKPGDLIVFYSGASHIGIYIGNGKLVHASNPRSGVKINSFSGYYKRTAIGAVRPVAYVIPKPATPKPTTPAKPSTPPKGSQPHKPSEPAQGGKGPEYTVRSGDTLSGIATTHKVKGGWQNLYATNREVIGSNPNLIYPHQTLALPTHSVSRTSKTTETPAVQSQEHAGWVSPVPGSISTPWNAKGPMWSSGRHTGVDFRASYGAPVKAAAKGVVIHAGWDGAYGNEIIVKHVTNFGTYYTQYAHLSAIRVSIGSHVVTGQPMGNVGATGNANGAHLHFEVRNKPSYGSDINPVAFLKAQGIHL